FFFFSSRRRHTRSKRDWSSDVCSSDLNEFKYILKVYKGCHIDVINYLLIYFCTESPRHTHLISPIMQTFKLKKPLYIILYKGLGNYINLNPIYNSISYFF